MAHVRELLAGHGGIAHRSLRHHELLEECGGLTGCDRNGIPLPELTDGSSDSIARRERDALDLSVGRAEAGAEPREARRFGGGREGQPASQIHSDDHERKQRPGSQPLPHRVSWWRARAPRGTLAIGSGEEMTPV
jgi:hypothetical protein